MRSKQKQNWKSKKCLVLERWSDILIPVITYSCQIANIKSWQYIQRVIDWRRNSTNDKKNVERADTTIKMYRTLIWIILMNPDPIINNFIFRFTCSWTYALNEVRWIYFLYNLYKLQNNIILMVVMFIPIYCSKQYRGHKLSSFIAYFNLSPSLEIGRKFVILWLSVSITINKNTLFELLVSKFIKQ
jgi:hypothetical protein